LAQTKCSRTISSHMSKILKVSASCSQEAEDQVLDSRRSDWGPGYTWVGPVARQPGPLQVGKREREQSAGRAMHPLASFLQPSLYFCYHQPHLGLVWDDSTQVGRQRRAKALSSQSPRPQGVGLSCSASHPGPSAPHQLNL
jgi:hypothetical protein